MTRPRPDYIPANLRTLDQVEEWAHDVGLDFFDVLWAWGSTAGLYELAVASGTTVTDLMERMVAAGGPEVGA